VQMRVLLIIINLVMSLNYGRLMILKEKGIFRTKNSGSSHPKSLLSMELKVKNLEIFRIRISS
jgi:hypothetical protein